MPANPYPKVPFVIQPEPFTLLYAEDLMTATPYTDPATGVAGAPTYSCQCIIPATHSLIESLKSTLMQMAGSAFPGMNIKYPMRLGDQLNAARIAKGKKPYDHYVGAFVLFAKSNEKTLLGKMLMPPRLVVLQNGAMVDYADAQRPLAAPFFYSGVKACGAFTLQGYAGFGGGITCYIDRIISFNTGDKISIGKSNEEVFGSADSMAQYVGHVSAESVMPQLQFQQPAFSPPPQQMVYQQQPVAPQPGVHPYAPGGIGTPPTGSPW